MGVDIIEVGFLIVFNGDFEVVSEIVWCLKNFVIVGLVCVIYVDIDCCGDVVKYVEKGCIYIFVFILLIYLKFQMNKLEDQVLDIIIDMVICFCNLIDDVEWFVMDVICILIEYLCCCVEVVIKCGVMIINLLDMVGYVMFEEYKDMFVQICEWVFNFDQVIFFVYCYDDLGLVVVNFLVGVVGGVCQIECIINGLGEWVGNVFLEEIVMVVCICGDILFYEIQIDLQFLMWVFKMVVGVFGFVV